MSTYMQKATDVQRKWYIIDAAGKPVGRVATVAASILRGKVKPTFTPHADCGDHVIIVNCKDAVFTGKKLDQKFYRRHSGYVSGLKSTSARDMMESKPEQAMYLAVKGMLPSTTVGRKSLTRLRVYRDANHDQAAQKPEAWLGEIK